MTENAMVKAADINVDDIGRIGKMLAISGYFDGDRNIDVAIAQMETDARKKVAEMNYRAAMERTAAQLNDHDEDREVKMATKQQELEQKDRSLAAEAYFKEKTGEGAGGAI